MANWYYTDANGQKQGLIDNEQLKELAAQGIITPDTPLETDTGYSDVAGQVPGLFTPRSPAPQTEQVPPPEPPAPAYLFCTNCGYSVDEKAYACMSCGMKPTGHKKFCRNCGVALEPDQVACVKCGFVLSGYRAGLFIGDKITPETVSPPKKSPAEQKPSTVTPPPVYQIAPQKDDASVKAKEALERIVSSRVPPSIPVKHALPQMDSQSIAEEPKTWRWIPLVSFLLLLAVGVIGVAVMFTTTSPYTEQVVNHVPLDPLQQPQQRQQRQADPVEQVPDRVASDPRQPPYLSPFADIYEAAAKGTAQDMRYFLGRGDNVNTADTGGWTPLHRAAEQGNAEVVQYLVSRGADVNVKNNNGATALDVASTEERRAALRSAIARGTTTRPQSPTSPYRSPFKDIFEAAEKGTVDDVKVFLDKGVDVNAKSNDGKTPLDIARERGKTEVCKYLVSIVGITNIFDAAAYGTVDDVRRFVNTETFKTIIPTAIKEATVWSYTTTRPANGWEQPSFNDSLWGIDHSGFGTVLHPPPPTVRTKWNTNDIWIRKSFELSAEDVADPSRLALTLFHDEDCEVFINGVAVLETTGYVGNYQLFPIENAAEVFREGTNVIAIHCRQTEGGQYIDAGISRGADTNVRESHHNNTPLHVAAVHNNNVEVLKYLVSQGADINARNKWDNTPLFDAAQYNSNVEVIKYLVSQGADVNAKNNDDRTPLDNAVRYSSNPDVEILQYLISQGADVNTRNKFGCSPFQEAIYCGNLEVAQFLLSQRGVSVNEKANDGGTALHIAARWAPVANVEVAKFLVSSGAVVNVRNKAGNTALDEARYRGGDNNAMIRYLISVGGRSGR